MKNTIFHNIFRIILSILTIYIASSGQNLVFAEEKPPLDAVVIMDSSGSMKKTDPGELRKPAAKLFISLLGEEDKLSVMSFSSQAWPITFLTQLNTEKNTNKALKATDKVSSKGIYTNIHAAITRGISMLKESQALERDPIIVLMSDGKMDVGDAQKNEELRQKIIDELIPQLNEHNIKIYSIAMPVSLAIRSSTISNIHSALSFICFADSISYSKTTWQRRAKSAQTTASCLAISDIH